MSGPASGRVALVTGGASGIGEAIARQWAAGGSQVVPGDIDVERGSRVAEQLGATWTALDVTVEAEMAAAVDLAIARFGRLDAMFNNAGAVGVVGPIASTSAADWRATIDVLLTGAFYGIKHAARVMVPRRSGAVVCTASVASLRGGLGPHVYTAAKHGIKGLVESVAVELATSGVRINGVAPGGTVSRLAARLAGDENDLDGAYARLAAASSSGVPTTADDVAAAALFLASPAAGRVNGVLLAVDGGDDLLGRAGRTFYPS